MLVIDTNLWVSYALNYHGSVARQLKALIRVQAFAFSRETFAELVDVLMREKFEPYATTKNRKQFLKTLAAQATWVEPQQTITDCRDPADNRFLEPALEAPARAILTGDRDLLTLHPFQGIPILTLTEAIAQLQG